MFWAMFWALKDALHCELYIMNYIACLTLKSHNKRTYSHVHRVCDMYVNLVQKKEKYI